MTARPQHKTSISTSAALGAAAVTTVSWNLRSLALNDPVRRAQKQGHVATLASSHNVVFLLEARGSLPTPQLWARQWLASHIVFYSTNSVGEAQAGIIILVQKLFLSSCEIHPNFSNVIGGRACALLLTSPKGPPLHKLAVRSERFDSGMVLSIKAVEKNLAPLSPLRARGRGLGFSLATLISSDATSRVGSNYQGGLQLFHINHTTGGARNAGPPAQTRSLIVHSTRKRMLDMPAAAATIARPAPHHHLHVLPLAAPLRLAKLGTGRRLAMSTLTCRAGNNYTPWR